MPHRHGHRFSIFSAFYFEPVHHFGITAGWEDKSANTSVHHMAPGALW